MTATPSSRDLLDSYDPFGAATMADPLPFYAQLREHSPVHLLPEYDTFVVSRFEDVWDVLGDTTGTFVSSESSLPSPETLRRHNPGPVADPPTMPMGSANMFGSPVYEEFRHAQGKPLRPGAVGRLEQSIRERARRRLAELLPRGTFDLVEDYAANIAAGSVCHILGLPLSLADEVAHVVSSATVTHDRAGGGLDKVALFRNSVAVLVPAIERHRRGETWDDADGAIRSAMVDGLLQFEFQGRRLTDEEIATNLVCVFVGGTETVPKVTAAGLWELAKDPAQLAAVRAGMPSSLQVAREEFIRYCAPAQWFLRTVREPTTIAGTEIRPGQRVMLLMGSAARDDAEFPDADRFQWDRPIDRVLSFGRGQHFCIGFHLARLEVAVLAEEFLRAVTDYEVDAGDAVRNPSSFQWGYTRVPVRVEPDPRWTA